MNADVARQVLELATQGGYFNGAMPEGEQLLSEADFYLTHARGAVESGHEDETVHKIVALVDGGGEAATESSSQGSAGAVGDAEDQSPSPPHTPADPEPDSTLSRTATAEHLPIPPQLQGEVLEMPRDISSAGDKQVRRLLGEYNAAINRTTWLLGIAHSDEANLTHLREREYQRAYLEEAKAAEAKGRKSTREDKDIAARQDAKYMEYDERVREAQERVRTFKALKEIYDSNIDRLSREGTLRDDEFKRGGK